MCASLRPSMAYEIFGKVPRKPELKLWVIADRFIGFKEARIIVRGATGREGFSKPLRAMDGPKRAHMDVLVGVF
ncbi:hypothetical protein [Marinobacter alkaliphilus]|uniref:Uncharacterized protein n=1 Tax=Marinobacter alkaliphilus TaxID=254719 RepID=A0ABZ3E9T6_9GAMM